jgi:putative transposase
MELIENNTYHIYNRGNNQQQIFFTNENYIFFLKKIRTELMPFCEILSYTLMPNHFHFVVFVKKKNNQISKNKTLSSAIAVVLRSYTRAIQRQQNFTGSLFQQKTKAKELLGNFNETINHLVICTHYIHQNPLKAQLVKNLKDLPYSSYLDYLGLRNGTLCNKELFYSLAGIDEKKFITESDRFISEKFYKVLF